VASSISGWWSGTFFFSPIVGMMTNIFQRGSNQQQDFVTLRHVPPFAWMIISRMRGGFSTSGSTDQPADECLAIPEFRNAE
jgi:hypothetical protein